MTLFYQLLIVGLASGAIYALIALGYTMVYGIIELINFAHGDIFMIGTLVAVTVFGFFGITNSPATWPTGWNLVGILLVTMIISTLICAVLGVVIERIAYRPLRNAPRLAPLISAIGVSLVLEDLGKIWKGNGNVPFPTIFPNVAFHFGPVTVNAIYLFVMVVAVILMLGLHWFITYTRAGRAMRAVAQDREAAALMGINVNRVISTTFFVGAGLAGAASVIFGLQSGTTVFNLGFNLGLVAFTAAVLGGIGNIVGAMLGGVVIGVVESLATLIPDSVLPHGGAPWTRAVIFAILILILVFRPSGLMGQQTPEKV
ncbi:MAG: branched-chain amino acid ABC transporter permease [Ktedonobacteraceae bacterium]|nr:branched-chain amino acid ABC transporter permease [Ktedonobacteraceae bacterium]MBO0790303.1 branched-chain amino acid ABC transporter permease [Ktedonobacteraceae bacterium]